jgi:transcriptional regulator with XRE-family HTH domain
MNITTYTVDVEQLTCLVQRAGISAAEFCRRAKISKDTWHRLLRGQRMVSAETKRKLEIGVRDIMNGRAQKLFVALPRGHVKILGNSQETRKRLRQAAEKRGMTMFQYLTALFEANEDPLVALKPR